jgi:hypothetical protein
MSPPRYRLAIFDFDGTLADSAGWIRDRLPELARAHHFHSPTPEELEGLRGIEPREVLRRLGIPAWKLGSPDRSVGHASLGSGGQRPPSLSMASSTSGA